MSGARVKRVNLRARGEGADALAQRALKVYRVYARERKSWESAYEIYRVLSDAGRLDEVLAGLAQFGSVEWDEERGAWTMRHGHVEVEVRCGEGGECEATITVNALAILFSAVEDLMRKVSILEEKVKGKE
jgi:hypothetical protein